MKMFALSLLVAASCGALPARAETPSAPAVGVEFVCERGHIRLGQAAELVVGEIRLDARELGQQGLALAAEDNVISIGSPGARPWGMITLGTYSQIPECFWDPDVSQTTSYDAPLVLHSGIEVLYQRDYTSDCRGVDYGMAGASAWVRDARLTATIRDVGAKSEVSASKTTVDVFDNLTACQKGR